jgi:hypothetical protein
VSLLQAPAAIGLACGLILSGGCAKKEEEKIIITIQTEKGEETAAEEKPTIPPPEQPVSDKPAVTTQAAPAAGLPKQELSRPKPPPVPEKTAPPVSEPVTSAAVSEPKPSREVSLVPMAPAPPSLEVPAPVRTDEELITAIVRRQEAAFEGKNVALYMSDLLVSDPGQVKEYERFFAKYETLDIDFEIQEIRVEGGTATAVLVQKTHLIPKRGKPQNSEAKIRWGLVKLNGDWKIKELVK